MPIGTGIIYNVGDLILSQVSGSGTAFLETKIAAATSSIVYFDNTARINSASLNSITVGTASYVSGSTSIITNLTASNISASLTGSFGMVGIGTNSPAYRLNVVTPVVAGRQTLTAIDKTSQNFVTFTNPEYSTVSSMGLLLRVFPQSDARQGAGIIASGGSFNGDTDLDLFVSSGSLDSTTFSAVKINARGSVGIGTTSPAQKLDVRGYVVSDVGSNAVEGGFYLGNGNHGLRRPGGSSNDVYLYTTSGTLYMGASGNSSQHLTILTGGNVGIGTTSPAAKLDVVSSPTAIGTIIRVRDTVTLGTGSFAGIHFTSSPGTDYTIGKLTTAAGDGFLQIRDQSGNQFVTVDSGGNVGIGTSSPQFLLDVVNTSTTAKLRIGNAGSNNGAQLILAGSNTTKNWVIANQQNLSGTLEFTQTTATGSSTVDTTPSMVINSSGNVGIGTTSPTAKLHIYNGSSHFEATSNGNAAIVAGLYALQIAPLSNRDSTAGSYYGGIAFNHLLNHNGVSTYNGAPQAWIGTRLQDTAGSERDYLVFATKPGTGTSGTGNDIPIERMCIDRDGLVGIGTTVPTARLHVSGSTGGVFEVDTAGGVTSFYVSASGLVGIGTSSPAVNLEVVGASETAGTIRINGGKVNVLAVGEINSALEFAQRDASIAGLVSGKIASISEFSNGAYAGLGFYTAQQSRVPELKEAVRITNNGDVGIGTSNPAFLLDVSGSSRHGYRAADTHQFTGSVSVSGSVTAASFTGSLSGSITSALTASYLTPANSYTITNLTASNISASLTGSFGIVGIGTASPGYTLEVNGTQRVVGNFYLFNTVVNPASNFSNQRGVGFEASTGKLEVAASGSDALSIGRFGSTGQILDFRYAGTQIGNFSLDTNDLTLATARHLILSSTGNVGIGTSSPSQKLTINNGSSTGAGVVYPIRLSGGTMSSVGDSTGLLFVQRDANDDYGAYIRLYTTQATPTYLNPRLEFGVQTTDTNVLGSVATRMVITGDGYVGIGTTSPVAALDVSRLEYPSLGGVLANFSAGTTDPTTEKYVILRQTYTGALYDSPMLVFRANANSANSGSFGIVRTTSNGSIVFSNVNATSGSVTAVSEKMRITADGNVGIGTTSPDGNSKLHVRGYQVYLYNDLDTNNTFFYARNSGAGNAGIKMKNSDGEWTIIANDRLRFMDDDAGVERLSILSDGNVGIGTTAPAAKLEISGSSNSALMNIKSAISGAILYVSGSGAVGIGTSNVGAYTLQVNGSFAATTKSFVIEHPTKAGKKLIYGSLESPYHGIRLTGRDTLVNGKCKIQLPDYIYKLILHDSVNIQLTGIKCNKTLYIDDINVPENYFTIAYDKAIFESYKDYDFFWDFTAIRADVPELQTEM